jgi:hypothetical protein
MRQFGALADAGGAAGIEERGGIIPYGLVGQRGVGIAPHELHEGINPFLGDIFAIHFLFHIGEQLLGGKRQVVVDVAGNDRFDAGLLLNFQHTGEKQVQGDQGGGFRIVELVQQFALGVERIVHDRDAPSL